MSSPRVALALASAATLLAWSVTVPVFGGVVWQSFGVGEVDPLRSVNTGANNLGYRRTLEGVQTRPNWVSLGYFMFNVANARVGLAANYDIVARETSARKIEIEESAWAPKAKTEFDWRGGAASMLIPVAETQLTTASSSSSPVLQSAVPLASQAQLRGLAAWRLGGASSRKKQQRYGAAHNLLETPKT